MKQEGKGGAVVTMNSKLCLKNTRKPLNEETTYKKVDWSCDTKMMREI